MGAAIPMEALVATDLLEMLVVTQEYTQARSGDQASDIKNLNLCHSLMPVVDVWGNCCSLVHPTYVLSSDKLTPTVEYTCTVINYQECNYCINLPKCEKKHKV